LEPFLLKPLTALLSLAICRVESMCIRSKRKESKMISKRPRSC